ncbi:hypothetical protein KKG29_05305 [Patescibacteria group bacterium]|nr:hypothetical protein [Patescibacteria group bacterium]MBU4057305.1 hypothetical protein [Patescibacteria group bacterium]
MNFRNINDEFINQNNARILSSIEIQPRYMPEKKTQEKPDKADVSDDIKTFLMTANTCQYRNTLTEINKLAGFSAGTGSRIAHYCEKKNLIKILQVKFGRGRPKYPVLLPDAYEILGINEKKFYGKGAGSEHILYQHLIKQYFSDHKPIIELNRNDKFIDVAINKNDLLVCIEVAMTSVNERENIHKDFSKAKADFVIVACIDQKVLKEVKEIVSDLPENIRNKTQAILLSELLSKKPGEFIESLQLPRH